MLNSLKSGGGVGRLGGIVDFSCGGGVELRRLDGEIGGRGGIVDKIFLAVTLLSLLHSTLQAQGRGEAYNAGEYFPMQRRSWKTVMPQLVLPDDQIALRNCDRCNCCKDSPIGKICESMTCCMESICTPANPKGSCTDPKPVTCGCDSDKCQPGPP